MNWNLKLCLRWGSKEVCVRYVVINRFLAGRRVLLLVLDRYGCAICGRMGGRGVEEGVVPSPLFGSRFGV